MSLLISQIWRLLSQRHSVREGSTIHRRLAKSGQRVNSCGLLGAILAFFIGIVAYTATPPDVPQNRLEYEVVLGQPGAAVLIVEYGAYGCPHCKAFHESGEIERLIDTYGDVQYVFRNAPIITINDRRGAEAAQCALDQGDEAFWTMHDAIFSLPTDEYIEADNSDLVGLAREAGLDADALEHCLDQRTHERTVDYWESNSVREGISFAPTLFVNGQRVDQSTLEAAVNAVLASEG